ncbi:hypothetical protein DFH08DRAFT_807325 [Mycena albidolilacea]|uniref:Uncharacterized protein n=1 Tax=Mycena albidolilacea TaxID=1033008 RepID=A0AAD7A5S9_9AGAR|nr:hypothetical protein DFH08DRAFT_807325 [Mycena albidolilacea]
MVTLNDANAAANIKPPASQIGRNVGGLTGNHPVVQFWVSEVRISTRTSGLNTPLILQGLRFEGEGDHYFKDPQLSYNELKTDYADEPELLADLAFSKHETKIHFNTYFASTTPDSAESQRTEPGSPQTLDFTSRHTQCANSGTVDELTEYFRLTSVPENWKIDPLE